jgi:hypothetical protein
MHETINNLLNSGAKVQPFFETLGQLSFKQ